MGKDYSSGMENPLGQRLREVPGPLLLTGHTGFKGTWMTFLLEHLNIPVVGYSLPAEKDSLFDRGKRTGAIPETYSDIRNYEVLEQFIDLHQPSTIVHMAAQPLVLRSYESPRETFDVNVMGTVNILDIAFKKDFVKAIIVVTTDKVYRNDNSGRAFIESDPLEGKDPYSASKVGTEAVVAAWQQIAKVCAGPRVASVRAGNVIGGGDFSQSRIIPDLIRGVILNETVKIRNPESTRPWQHVLEPLFGYLTLLESLIAGSTAQSANFGPNFSQINVGGLVEIGCKVFPALKELIAVQPIEHVAREAEILQINSDLSKINFGWEPKWDSSQAITLTFNWWKDYLNQESNVYELCTSDISRYFS
jgi:CDP-glucose 4,6-dehydratase